MRGKGKKFTYIRKKWHHKNDRRKKKNAKKRGKKINISFKLASHICK